MEDIIDIIVTETTNLIEITSQPTDEIIDVNIIDNRENVTLNVTPTVVEININSLTGNFGVNWGEITGTLSNQTDLQNALNLKADLVGGKVPSSQLPSYVDDVVEVANYALLPTTGETGKIYITLDTNYIYRWSGTVYVQILDSAAVWGAITGSLSSQSDLVTALSGKFNNPTGDTTQYIAGDGSLITFPVAGQAGSLVREVRNTTGATLTKGTIVYISGATGNKPTVSKALATGDSTSAQTFGMLQADLANNANGYVVCVGNITGLDTSALTEGVQLYLSSTTAGTYTTTKQVAPAHLVYIGVVTRSHPTLGQIEVKIQNGYELDELHDVSIVSKANNEGLFYESSTNLWKNKSIATVLGYSPEQPLTFASPLIRTSNAISIQVATGSQNGYLSSTDWTTFNSKQAALSGTGFVKISGTTISYDNSTYLTTSAAATTYLALGGGTMTGSLIGTSAGFTGYVGIGNTSPLYQLDVTGNGRFSGDLRIESTNPRIYLTDTDNNPDYFISNTDGTFTIYDVTNSTARFTIGATGNATFANAITGGGSITGQSLYSNGIISAGTSLSVGTFVSAGGSLTGSALYVSGMTAGNGAIYHSGNRLTFANYNSTGTLHFEVNGGTGALTLNADTSASFVSGLSTGGQISLNSGFGTSTPAISIYNNNGASASNIARLEFRLNNSFGGNERVAFITALNPNAAGNNGGALAFSTSANGTGTTPTERVRIDQSGNVGIGTTTPGAKLEVNGQINALNGAINFGGTGSAGSTDPAIYRVGSGINDMAFAIGSIERMRITSAGSVFIGKTTGSSKFGVSGLPTSSAGLSSGDFYQVAGAVMVVP